MELGDVFLSGEALQSKAAASGDAVMTVILVSLWVVIVLGVIGFALYWRSFKYKVRIRVVAKNRKIIVDDRAKLRKKGSVEYWFFRKRRVFVQIPPPEALEVDARGRFVAECYHKFEAGKHFGYYWITDDNSTINDKVQLDFKPLPTEKQSHMVERLRRAEARKGKSLFENLIPIVMTIGMIVAVTLPLVFYGDLAKANQDQFERITSVEMAIANKLDDVVSKAGCYQPFDYSSDVPLSEQIKPPEVNS